MTVHVGEVFRRGESEPFRVVATSGDSAFCVPLSASRTCLPCPKSLSELERAVENGETTRIPETVDVFRIRRYSESEIQEAFEKWTIVNDYWTSSEGRNALLTKQLRPQAFVELGRRLEISPNRAREVMARFWRGGMVSASLLPRSPRSRGESPGGERRGKKPVQGAYSGLVGEEERRIFEDYYNKFKCDTERTIQKAYLAMIRDHYTETSGGEGLEAKSRIDVDSAPSVNQFRYWVKKHRDPVGELQGHLLPSERQNNHSMDYSSSALEVIGPGSIFELDATHLNIELVSEGDRSLRVGTPLMHVLVDVSTRMVVGYTLTLENESWRTAAKAIMNAVADKKEYCASLGLEIDEYEWPSHHLPAIIMADNAKFNEGDTLIYNSTQRSQIKLGRPYIAKDKPVVERAHKKIKDFIKEELPGAILKKIASRGERDPADCAILTLGELERVVALVVLGVNGSIIRNYPLSPRHTGDGACASPRELWREAVERSRDSLVVVDDPEGLRHSLLPSKKRVVQDFGVEVDLFKYSSKDPEKRDELLGFLGTRIEVMVDPDDVDHVYIPMGDHFLELDRHNADDDFHGMTREEAKKIHDLQRAQAQAALPVTQARQFDYNREIEKIVDEAKRRTMERLEVTKINKKKRENRKAEKEAMKEGSQGAGRPGKATESPSPTPRALPGQAEVEAFLKKKKEDGK